MADLGEPPKCFNTGCINKPQEGKKFDICARCKTVAYCGKECQKAHWKLHKSECKDKEPLLPSKGIKDHVDGAAYIAIHLEKQIFAYVRKQINTMQARLPKSRRWPTDKMLDKCVNDWVVRLRCDHIKVSIIEAEKCVTELSKRPLDISLVSVKDLEENVRDEIAAGSGKCLYVHIIKKDFEGFIPIHEGIKDEVSNRMMIHTGEDKKDSSKQ